MEPQHQAFDEWATSESLPQFYTTVMVDDRTDLLLNIISVPRRSLENQRLLKNQNMLLKELELVRSFPPQQDRFVEALKQYLSNISTYNVMFAFGMAAPTNYRAADFATRVYEGARIPVESSPLKGKSLSELLGGPESPAPIIIWASAALISGEHTELVLLLLPIGMIILGAARGIANGLEKGLEQRVLRLLKRRGREGGTAPPGAPRRRPQPPMKKLSGQ